MVTPAMELATKIPDIHVQLWSTALLKGNNLAEYYFLKLGFSPYYSELYRLCGNNIQAQQQAQQADQLHTKYSQVIMNDYYLATQSQEHNFYLNVSNNTQVSSNYLYKSIFFSGPKKVKMTFYVYMRIIIIHFKRNQSKYSHYL